MLAVGLVVDDAIVVVEAIEAKIEQGRSPRDAALEAMDEVGGALVGIALVLSAVFIPAGFMAGITGSLYRQFALTIAFSVLLSAFNALTLSPALGAMLLRPRSTTPARGPLARFFALFNAGFERAQNGYVSICGLLIRKLVLALAIAGRALPCLPAGIGRIAAAIVPARRRPGLLPDERRAARSRVAAAHRRGDEEDRRDPEDRTGVFATTTRSPATACSRRPAAAVTRVYFCQLAALRRAHDLPRCKPRAIVAVGKPEAGRAARRAGLCVPAARRFPASVRPAASISSSRTTPARRSTTSGRTRRSSSPPRASVPNWRG